MSTGRHYLHISSGRIPVSFHDALRGTHSDHELEMLLDSKQMNAWNKSLTHEMAKHIEQITILSADYFDNNKKVLGFLRFSVLMVKNGIQSENNFEVSIKYSKIVIARGNSVGILLILVGAENGQEFVVTVKQERVPVGDWEYEELIAGMQDYSGNILGKAVEEVEEETQIKIEIQDVVELPQLCGFGRSDFSLSPGLLDEHMRYFLVRKTLPLREIRAINDRIAGKASENEAIKVCIRTINEFKYRVRNTNAAFMLACYMLYKIREQGGVDPALFNHLPDLDDPHI